MYMAKSMELEVDESDVEELVEDHQEELVELQSEQMKTLKENDLSKEKEEREKITSTHIKEIVMMEVE